METWATIKGFAYKVSDSGKIWSIRKDKELKPHICNGYPKVDLYDNWNRKKYYIHQLVATYFHSDSYFKGAIVNHKDGNKMNNNKSNLEWVTYSENMHHSYRELGRKSPKPKGSASCHATAIIQTTLDGKIISMFGSITEAQQKYGGCIERCLSGKNKTAYGFKWTYAD